MKPKIIFLLNSVDLNRGGLTHASLRQASTFADAGYDTDILTFRYEPRFPEIVRKLKKKNKVSNKVRLRSLFDERAGYHNQEVKIDKMKVDISDYKKEYEISKRNSRNAFRLYKDGKYEKYISLRSDDTLDFIDYFNSEGNRTHREHYNYYGDMTRVKYYSLEENKMRKDVFLDKNGDSFLIMWWNPATEERIHVTSFGKDHTILSETDGDTGLHRTQWLQEVIEETETPPIVISDTRSTDELLVRLGDTRAKCVIRPHSNHLKDPDDPESELNARNRYAINNMDKVDALAVLTEKQKLDISERFGHGDKIHVIPNYYEANQTKKIGKSFIRTTLRETKNLLRGRQVSWKRNMLKVVIISRFSSIKNIDHVIKAFKKVVEAVPGARLEIWGGGNKKKEYLALINELELTRNVFIKGYTHHPERIYRSGALSAVTSKAEGFSLSVMESMVNETPVISYDIRYGPSDMIDDGKNGYLIEKGDIDTLSERMISMLKNPDKTRQMGREAKNKMDEKFDINSYRKKWFTLVDDLMKQDES